MKEDYFTLKKLYGNNEDIWEEFKLLDRRRIEQLDKETKLQEELNQLNSQYSEVCLSLNILDEKVFLLTRQMEELNEELEWVRTNNQ